VCSGPFRFVERIAQDRITLERYPNYWNKSEIHFDRIVYQPIPDATVRLANLRSGGLDLLERLNATDMAAVKGDSKLKLNELPDLSYFGLTINVANGDKSKNPLGQHAKVRQALELAIDREALNQVVFNGEFVPGNQWISPSNAYYQKSLPLPKRDVARAKALIKEVGVPTPIVIDFMVPQGAENKAVSEVVQAMAAEAGFDLKIRVTEFATSLKQAEQGEYQMYMRADTPYKTIEDVRNAKEPPRCGAQGTSDTAYYLPKLFEELIGTKFNLVQGYPGGPEIDLAVERGEIHCRAFTIEAFL